MSKQESHLTMAVRFLKENNIEFKPYLFNYEEKGGTKHTAAELNVDEHFVVKTLIMQTDTGDAFIVLMHGDCEVSQKEMARLLCAKKVEPCEEKKAFNLTGYQFGGTSPFGTKTKLPVFAESTIFKLPKIYINGGRRGFIVELNPVKIIDLLKITEVSVAIKK